MKKFLALLLVFLMISPAMADGIDLSGLSFEELIDLRNRINMAMWQCEEWQEVKVPQGTWKVGEDIPAGHWTVKCAPGAYYCEINWGEKLSENKESISWSGRNSVYNKVYNKEKYPNSDEYQYEYSFEVFDGDYIVIDDGSAIFMPYVGKPSFGFK